MNDTTQTLVRSFLKIGAGWLIAKGYLSDSQSAELIGAVAALIGVLWGVAHRTPANPPPPKAPGLLLVLCLAGAAAVAGCTATQQTTAYRTLYSLEQSVTAANSAYVDLVIKGQAPTNDLPRIRKIYDQFQADLTLALDAVQFNTNALAPASLATEAADLINVINTATAK